jgi:hypothetical protein
VPGSLCSSGLLPQTVVGAADGDGSVLKSKAASESFRETLISTGELIGSQRFATASHVSLIDSSSIVPPDLQVVGTLMRK